MQKSIHENAWYLIKIGLLFLILVIAKSCETDSEARSSIKGESNLLLISIDGFRYDYFALAETPTFDSLISVGAKAGALIPVFPSKTFPNHYTQVTGLYPENHGIISNRMYDAGFDEYFSIGSGSRAARDGKWYQGEPIWATAKMQGLRTATMFWPGSDAEINGVRPDEFYPYNHEISPDDRIDQVFNWLEAGPSSPQLITLYFEQVDRAGHLHGPQSKALESSVAAVDGSLGRLMDGMFIRGLADKINVILVSDHGMTSLSRDKVIFLDDYIDLDQVELINQSPVAELIPSSGEEQNVFDQLKGAHPHLKVFRKGNIPLRWHYNTHHRITPIIAVADEGWSITSKAYFDSHPQAYQGGSHGYDPAIASMGGIFVAAGPAFKPGVAMDAVEAIHLYELMCKLLGVEPAENEGEQEVWNRILN